MKNFIVESYSNSFALEESLNKMDDKYFPMEIFYVCNVYTVVYCRRDIMYVKQMKDVKY